MVAPDARGCGSPNGIGPGQVGERGHGAPIAPDPHRLSAPFPHCRPVYSTSLCIQYPRRTIVDSPPPTPSGAAGGALEAEVLVGDPEGPQARPQQLRQQRQQAPPLPEPSGAPGQGPPGNWK